MCGAPYEVVGVAPAGFSTPDGAELWAPIALTDEQWANRRNENFGVIGRLADGATVEQARAELTTIVDTQRRDHAETNVRRYALLQSFTNGMADPGAGAFIAIWQGAALLLLFYAWQPMGGVMWDVQDQRLRGVLYGLFAGGLLLVLIATFLINHFDLFGMRQVWLYLQGRPYVPLTFSTPGLYRYVRHPLYVGWLVTFWAAPTMTAAHLVFALATTIYMLLAIRWEERDLTQVHGVAYEAYRERVPMLIPAVRASVTAGQPAPVETA